MELIISEWKKKYDKILFITGEPGSGKTYIANEIIKDYDPILININSNFIEQFKEIFTISNISIMMNNYKRKILFIDDYISINIKLLKELTTYNKPIVIIITEPIQKNIKDYIYRQYHINIKYTRDKIFNILKEKYQYIDDEYINKIINNSNNNLTSCVTNMNFNISCQDIFKKNIINDINKIIKKTIDIKIIDTITEPYIVALHLLENIIDEKLTVHLYESICSYNSNIYNNVYNELYYLIIPYMIIRNKNKDFKEITKYTKYISRQLIYKSQMRKNYKPEIYLINSDNDKKDTQTKNYYTKLFKKIESI